MDVLQRSARRDVPSYPAGWLLGRGLVQGHDFIRKFGFSSEIPMTESTIWDGVGTQGHPDYQTVGGVVTVSSTDANDTSGGTGMQTARVYGLDDDWLPQDEVVALDGQTGVDTVGSYIRAFRGHEESTGSGGVNAGTVWFGAGVVTAGVPATRYLAISPGENQSLHAAWSGPAGKKVHPIFVFASSFSNQNAFATIRFLHRPFGGSWRVKEKFVVSRGSVPIPLDIPAGLDGKSDYRVVATASSGTIDVSALFTAFIV